LPGACLGLWGGGWGGGGGGPGGGGNRSWYGWLWYEDPWSLCCYVLP
jgi:hypothetical protein